MNDKARIFLTQHLEEMTYVATAMEEMSGIYGESGEGGMGLFSQVFQKIAFSYLEMQAESTPQNFIEFIYDVTLSLNDLYRETVESFNYASKERLIHAIKEDMTSNMNWSLNFNGVKDDIDTILNACHFYDIRNGSRSSEKVSAAILGFSTDSISALADPPPQAREMHEKIKSYLSEKDSEVMS
jgi:hypothetical protein